MPTCSLCGQPASHDRHQYIGECLQHLRLRVAALEAGMDEGKRSILAALHNEQTLRAAADERCTKLESLTTSLSRLCDAQWKHVAALEVDNANLQAQVDCLQRQLRSLYAALHKRRMASLSVRVPQAGDAAVLEWAHNLCKPLSPEHMALLRAQSDDYAALEDCGAIPLGAEDFDTGKGEYHMPRTREQVLR